MKNIRLFLMISLIASPFVIDTKFDINDYLREQMKESSQRAWTEFEKTRKEKEDAEFSKDSRILVKGINDLNYSQGSCSRVIPLVFGNERSEIYDFTESFDKTMQQDAIQKTIKKINPVHATTILSSSLNDERKAVLKYSVIYYLQDDEINEEQNKKTVEELVSLILETNKENCLAEVAVCIKPNSVFSDK